MGRERGGPERNERTRRARWAGVIGPALLLLLAAPPPWPHTAQTRLADRFPPPPGAARVEVPSGSFGAWLRDLPIQPGRPAVQLHDGTPKRRQDAHAAVIDIDVGPRDLQQCADLALRLHAEWRRARGGSPCYRFTSGHPARWSDWRSGMRPRIRGSRVRWQRGAAPSSGYPSFRRYLDLVFTYAGSASLERDTLAVAAGEVAPGDLLVQGGHPGHVVVVLDVARSPDGDAWVLLGQSFMPAQSPHVLRAAADRPWFPAPRADRPYPTPEWTFPADSLRRFPADPCRATRGRSVR